jgi:hypothetical protein
MQGQRTSARGYSRAIAVKLGAVSSLFARALWGAKTPSATASGASVVKLPSRWPCCDL